MSFDTWHTFLSGFLVMPRQELLHTSLVRVDVEPVVPDVVYHLPRRDDEVTLMTNPFTSPHIESPSFVTSPEAVRERLPN